MPDMARIARLSRQWEESQKEIQVLTEQIDGFRLRRDAAVANAIRLEDEMRKAVK